MNHAEAELFDGINTVANKYRMNSRTLLKLLEAEGQRIKEAWEGHPEVLPEQLFNELVKRYTDSEDERENERLMREELKATEGKHVPDYDPTWLRFK